MFEPYEVCFLRTGSSWLSEGELIRRQVAGSGRSLHPQQLQPGVPAPHGQRSVRMPCTLRRRSSRVRAGAVTRSRQRCPRSRCPMRRAVATESASGHRVVWQVSTRIDVYRTPSASMSARLRHCWSACALSTADPGVAWARQWNAERVYWMIRRRARSAVTSIRISQPGRIMSSSVCVGCELRHEYAILDIEHTGW